MMVGVKIYPEFTLQTGASVSDERFLKVLQDTKKSTQANYVNYSVFDYQGSTCEMRHFLTYPMDWIAHYLKHSFQDIDPLLSVDYRRVSHIDWSDIWRTNDEYKFFAASLEYGIGDNGLSFISHLEGQVYGAMSLVFDNNFENWHYFRDQNLALMRLQAERLSQKYQELFMHSPQASIQLTQREMESLRWVALGKTDQQISGLMKIGRWTVNSHIKSLINKLKVPNRAAAVAKALSSGLLVLDTSFEN